ncbi:MAG: hypothetical protein GF331_07310 [Chitinivibrionales bacterium]|nr:hypothetical protein [Chitinivibrionales bacterium]
MALRVPSWARTFRVSIGDTSFDGTPGERAVVNRVWTKGDQIHVALDYPVVLLNGGKSYPAHAALKRGPLVLAVDSLLNAGLDSVGSVTIVAAHDIELTPATERLSEGWFGTLAYTTEAVTATNGETVVLTPFATTGQYGNSYLTWLRKK